MIITTAIWVLVNVLLVVANTKRALRPDDVLVKLSHGPRLRGIALKSEKGKTFYAFKGIRYAEPPVGELRFKAPVPKTSWNEEKVFDATRDGPVCFQIDIRNKTNFVGQEDCLYLNIYSPELPRKRRRCSRRSVMIYLHGGGFKWGDGTSVSYPPERLMDSDIVLVTINYRQAALGFLSTGDAASPGNYGLLDQTLAFQWVKENIEAFGGDLNSVALFGESSGGVCVSYHLLSPLSEGLFHSAIAMSGTSLSAYAFERNPLRWAERLASQTGCPQQPTSAMVECFRSKPIKDLLSNNFQFSPAVDDHFLLASPRYTMTYTPNKINKVHVLRGCTEMEASGLVSGLKKSNPNVTVTSEEAYVIMFNNSITNYDINIIRRIRDRYLKSVDITNELEANKAIIKAYTDGQLLMNHYAEAQLLSKAGLDVYTYSYDYAAVNADEDTKRYGVGHTQDLFVLFNISKFPFEDRDYKMVDIMTSVWSNFAKTGHPDPAHKYLPEWKPTSPEMIYIHHLNLSLTIEDYDANQDEMFTFWNQDVEAARNRTNYD